MVDMPHVPDPMQQAINVYKQKIGEVGESWGMLQKEGTSVATSPTLQNNIVHWAYLDPSQKIYICPK